MQISEKGKFGFDLTNSGEVYKYARWLAIADEVEITNAVIEDNIVKFDFERSTGINTTPSHEKDSKHRDMAENIIEDVDK